MRRQTTWANGHSSVYKKKKIIIIIVQMFIRHTVSTLKAESEVPMIALDGGKHKICPIYDADDDDVMVVAVINEAILV